MTTELQLLHIYDKASQPARIMIMHPSSFYSKSEIGSIDPETWSVVRG